MQRATERETEPKREDLGRLLCCTGSFERVFHLFACRCCAQRAEVEDRLIAELNLPGRAPGRNPRAGVFRAAAGEIRERLSNRRTAVGVAA